MWVAMACRAEGWAVAMRRGGDANWNTPLLFSVVVGFGDNKMEGGKNGRSARSVMNLTTDEPRILCK